jgi:hypothetical protein
MNSRRRVNSNVMWHRFLINALAIAQYVIYLVVGAYFFLLASLLNLGVSFFPTVPKSWLWLFFSSLVLGGYASASAFIFPRVAGGVAGFSALPFMWLGLSKSWRTAFGLEGPGTFWVLLCAIVLLVSLTALLWSEGSIWRRSRTWGKIIVVIFGLAPAAYATYWLLLSIWAWAT